ARHHRSLHDALPIWHPGTTPQLSCCPFPCRRHSVAAANTLTAAPIVTKNTETGRVAARPHPCLLFDQENGAGFPRWWLRAGTVVQCRPFRCFGGGCCPRFGSARGRQRSGPTFTLCFLLITPR